MLLHNTESHFSLSGNSKNSFYCIGYPNLSGHKCGVLLLISSSKSILCLELFGLVLTNAQKRIQRKFNGKNSF